MYNCIKNNLIDNKYFYLKLLSLLSIILLLINIFLLILGYYICKWLYKKVYNEFFSTDCYTNYQKQIIKKYGNFNINKIYIVKNNTDIFNNCFIINILNFIQPNCKIFLQNNTFNHYAIICNLKNNKESKFILIEKNACMRIKTNFSIKENKILKSVKLEKNWKFKDILNNTKKRIGKKQYFNWNIYENNCQHWVKEILITLGKFNKNNAEFIMQDLNCLNIFPRWKLNILTIIVNLSNILL